MAAVTQSPAMRLSPLQEVKRFVRLITTAISFALFGVAGLLLAGFVFPAFFLFIRDRKKRAAVAQATVHKAWWLYVRVMQAMGTVSFEFDHPEILANLRGTIVVANHPSLLDVVFLMSAMRRTRAVVKKGVATNPFMRGVVLAADYIPNMGDPEKLIADCAEALRQGYNLCIFPEGSRTPDGAQRRYQKGFAHIALLAGAPIQIVTIQVNPPTLRKGEPWYATAPVRAHWTIKVHERIDTAGQYGYDRSASAVKRLTADVADRIEGLLRA
jgi:1-acyl-sn-glycerol-3-phosphate acyltransferase